jgi:regulator of sirC expression with transglutaminase-like and TPR domain
LDEALNARERFSQIVSSERPIDLAEAALWVAAEEYPSLDVASYLAKLERLAAEASSRIDDASGESECARALNRFLFVERGFAGNRDDYYDPRNSYLNDVLDRRSGIPITLSIVYMAVAKRLGRDVRGISFPGHFLLKWAKAPEIVVDAFAGRTLTTRDCQERLEAAAGRPLELRPEIHLRAASEPEILVRMLGNLKRVFVQRRDHGRALGCCERLLLLMPDAPLELRDRGLILERLDCFRAAIADLDRFMALAPDDPSVPAVRRRRDALATRARMLH